MSSRERVSGKKNIGELKKGTVGKVASSGKKLKPLPKQSEIPALKEKYKEYLDEETEVSPIEEKEVDNEEDDSDVEYETIYVDEDGNEIDYDPDSDEEYEIVYEEDDEGAEDSEDVEEYYDSDDDEEGFYDYDSEYDYEDDDIEEDDSNEYFDEEDDSEDNYSVDEEDYYDEDMNDSNDSEVVDLDESDGTSYEFSDDYSGVDEEELFSENRDVHGDWENESDANTSVSRSNLEGNSKNMPLSEDDDLEEKEEEILQRKKGTRGGDNKQLIRKKPFYARVSTYIILFLCVISGVLGYLYYQTAFVQEGKEATVGTISEDMKRKLSLAEGEGNPLSSRFTFSKDSLGDYMKEGEELSKYLLDKFPSVDTVIVGSDKIATITLQTIDYPLSEESTFSMVTVEMINILQSIGQSDISGIVFNSTANYEKPDGREMEEQLIDVQFNKGDLEKIGVNLDEFCALSKVNYGEFYNGSTGYLINDAVFSKLGDEYKGSLVDRTKGTVPAKKELN